MIYLLNKNIHKNIYNFISSNSIPKIYPNISQKSIWTNEFENVMQPILKNYNTILLEIKNSLKYNNLYLPIGKHYGDEEIKKWKSCNIIKDRSVLNNMNLYFPNTIKLINNLELFYGWLFVSILEPNAYIPKHRGRYNHKLTCHLGIEGLDNCKFIIDNKIIKWEKGKFFVFNDFSYHEVKHEGKENRIVLIFDFFHPELSKKEIKQIKQLGI